MMVLGLHLGVLVFGVQDSGVPPLPTWQHTVWARYTWQLNCCIAVTNTGGNSRANMPHIQVPAFQRMLVSGRVGLLPRGGFVVSWCHVLHEECTRVCLYDLWCQLVVHV